MSSQYENYLRGALSKVCILLTLLSAISMDNDRDSFYTVRIKTKKDGKIRRKTAKDSEIQRKTMKYSINLPKQIQCIFMYFQHCIFMKINNLRIDVTRN